MVGNVNVVKLDHVTPLLVDKYPFGRFPDSLAANSVPLCMVKFFAQICVPVMFVAIQFSPPFVERYSPLYAPVKSVPLSS
jgi:hypothetical protein